MTTHNWRPISEFDFSAAYASGSFLVWLSPLPDYEMGDHFQECWIEDGRFVGTWRHITDEGGAPLPGITELEPVAFMLIEAPSFIAEAAA